jgi:hypothetical protein
MVVLDYDYLIKNKKKNIGIQEAPNMAIIRDYLGQDVVNHVVDILK